MKAVNVWLVLTQTAVTTLRPLMDDQDYDGEHLKAVRIFRKMADYVTVEKMFKRPTIASKKRFLLSVNFTENLGQAKDAIDYLLATYPSQVAVAGAWWWDGRQVGTQWVDPEDHSQGVTGTPTYPIIANQLVKFMPDVWDGVDPDNLNYVTATAPADINLVQGQNPRRFS